MKTLTNLLLLTLFLCVGITGVEAQQTKIDRPSRSPFRTVFSEGFEDATAPACPAGWTSNLAFANAFGRWSGTTNCSVNEWSSYGGSLMAGFITSNSAANDAWLISPAFNLTAGKTYRIQFWLKVGATNSSLATAKDLFDVHIGTSDETTDLLSATTVYIHPENSRSANFILVEETYTAESTGSHYLGFYCHSEAKAARICIDDIVVDYEEAYNNDLTIGIVDFPYTQVPFNHTFGLQVDNIGLQAQTNVKVTASLNGQTPESAELASLAAGASADFTVSGLAAIQPGTNTVSFSVSQTETDEDPNDNQTKAYTFTGTKNVYAMDNGTYSLNYISVKTFIGGNVFPIAQDIMLNEVTIGHRSLGATTFKIHVYEMLNATTIANNPMATFDVEQTNTATGYIGLIPYQVTPTLLQGGKSYFVCAESTGELALGFAQDTRGAVSASFEKKGNQLDTCQSTLQVRIGVQFTNDLAISDFKYTQMPTNHNIGMQVSNVGVADQTNVKVSATLNGEVLNASELATLTAGQSADFVVPSANQIQLGENTVQFSVSQTETDDYAHDNQTQEYTFTGTENVYAMDNGTYSLDYISGKTFIGGNVFPIAQDIMLNEVTIGHRSLGATTFKIHVYEMLDATTIANNPMATFDVEQTNTATGYIGLIPYQVTPTLLQGGKSYFVCAESTGELALGFAQDTRGAVGASFEKKGNQLDTYQGTFQVRIGVMNPYDLEVSTPYAEIKQLPLSQVENLQATVNNIGGSAMTNVKVTATLNNEVIGESEPIASLAAGASQDIEFVPTTPVKAGDNTIVFNVLSDEEDENPVNNTTAVTLNVTKNILAVDNTQVTHTSGRGTSNATLGNIIPVLASETLSKVRIAFTDDSKEMEYEIALYEMDGDATTATEPIMTQTATRRGRMMFDIVDVPETALEAGKSYFLCIRVTEALWFAYDQNLSTGGYSRNASTGALTATGYGAFCIQMVLSDFANDLTIDFPYTQVPKNHALSAYVRNAGTAEQTQVQVSASFNEEAVNADELAALPAKASAMIALPVSSKVQLDANTVSFSVLQNETDDDASDNETAEITFTGSEGIYALDKDTQGITAYASRDYHLRIPLVLGNVFPIAQSVTLNEVLMQCYIAGSAVSSDYKISVYQVDGDSVLPTPIVTATGNQAKTSGWTGWFATPIPATVLNPGIYYVCVESTEETPVPLGLGLGADATAKHSFIKIGNQLATPSSRPFMIRLSVNKYDAGITQIVAPVEQDEPFTNAETLTVKIKNYADAKLNGVYVNALINGEPLYASDKLIWNLPGEVMAVNEERNYTFDAAIDLSARQNHAVTVYAYSAGETAAQHEANDTVKTVLDNRLIDLQVAEFTAPTSGVSLSATSDVTVNVTNLGTQDVENVSITLMLGTDVMATENIAAIAQGETVPFTFAEKLDLSTVGEYTITVFTDVPNDEISGNDTLTHTINCFDAVIIDAKLEAVTAPTDGENLGEQAVTIRVLNKGSEAITSLPAELIVNGGAAIPQTFTTSIAAGSSELLTFSQTADLSAEGNHTIKVIVSLEDDADHVGDTLEVTVNNTIVEFVVPTDLAVVTDQAKALITWTHDRVSTLGYNVYLNSNKVASAIQDTFYTFTNLTDGNYIVNVEAVYQSGVSSRAEKGFTIKQTLFFTEDFENPTATNAFPAGWWSDQEAGTAKDQWFTGKLNYTSGFTPHSGENAAGVRTDGGSSSDAASNTWIISPAFQLTSGTTYKVSYWLHTGVSSWLSSTGVAERLGMHIGTQQLSSAMTETLYELPDGFYRGSWYLVSTTYTAQSTGDHYLGFHCYTPKNGTSLAIDDISVTALHENDLTVELPVVSDFPYMQIPTRQTLPAMTQQVSVKNLGSAEQTQVKASVLLNNTQEIGVSPELASLAAGASEELTVSIEAGAAIKAGSNTLHFAVSQQQTDDVPEDNKHQANIVERYYFTGSANIFALESGEGPVFTNSKTTNVGSVFPIYEQTTLNQVSLHCYINNTNTFSTNFRISVYRLINETTLESTPIVTAESNQPKTTTGFSDWLYVDMPSTTLTPGKYYVYAESTEEGKGLGLAGDRIITRKPQAFTKEGDQLVVYTGNIPSLRIVVDMYDFGVSEIISPAANADISATDVKVKIKNYATVKTAGVYVNALVNGTPLYENDLLIWESDPLEAGAEREYTFTVPAEWNRGENTVEAYAYSASETDLQRANDTLKATPFILHSDLEVVEFTTPKSGVGLSATESVSVKVANLGTGDAASSPITLKLAEDVITETLPAIPAGDTVTFTFETQTFDLSAEGAYVFTAFTELSDDVDPSNDTLRHTVNCFTTMVADLAAMSVTVPTENTYTASALPVTIQVRNNGTETAENVSVYVSLNDETPITGIIDQINAQSTRSYTLPSTLALAPGSNTIMAYVAMIENDTNVLNDTIQQVFGNTVDVQAVAIITPTFSSGDNLGEETVTVSVQNNGSYRAVAVPVTLMLNDEIVVATTIDTIDAGGENGRKNFVFAQQADLSAEGEHTIRVFTALSGDQDASNDTVSKTVENRIEIITNPEALAVDVSGTDATFTWKHDREDIIGFNIYLDAIKKATEIADTFYVFTNLATGNYKAGVEAVYLSGVSDLVTVDFTISESGIADKTDNLFVIYPNPTSERLFIQTTASVQRIEIYDLQGKLIKADETNVTEIAVGDLKTGAYTLKLTTDQGISTQRFIKH